MRRLLPLLLAVLLLLAACGGEPAPSAAPTTTIPTTGAPETVPESIAPVETEAPFDPIPLLETEYFSFILTNITVDDIWGYTFQVRCENYTEGSLLFQIPSASCRGWLLTADCSVMAGPGEIKNSDFNVWPSDLERCGMDTLDELRFRLRVADPDNFAEALADEICVVYPTGLTEQELGPSPVHQAWPREESFVDNDEFRFAICGQDADNIWTYNLTLYLENKTEKAVTFTWQDVTVNGIEADPWLYYTVPAGLKACFNIYFDEDDMKAKEIASLELVDFTLVVTPFDSFRELYRESFSYSLS